MSVPRVLVIDHTMITQRLAVAALTSHGYEACAVASAEDANEVIGRWQPDVILAEQVVGGPAGLALNELLEHDRTTRQASIVLLTSPGTPPLAADAIDDRVDGFLEKPFDATTLVRKVQWHLEARTARLKRPAA